MGDRLATIDVGRKVGAAVLPFWGGAAGSPCNTIDMGGKVGLCPFLGGAGFPSNTLSPGPRPSSVPSGIFIHPAVWPQ